MRIFIARLNGKILTDYTHQDDQDQSLHKSGSSLTSSSSTVSNQNSKSSKQHNEKQLEIDQYNKRTLTLQIIDHSRKLPLLQYDNELNYVRIRGQEFFYLARHKLLFVYTSHKDEYTVMAIENILNNCIRSYQALFENICTGKRLPNYLTDYQAGEFQKLNSRIRQIVAEQDHFELKRSHSFKDSSEQPEISLRSIGERGETFQAISEKQLKRKEDELNYLYQTEKKLNKYRLKLCLLALLIALVAFIGLYLLLSEKARAY